MFEDLKRGSLVDEHDFWLTLEGFQSFTDAKFLLKCISKSNI